MLNISHAEDAYLSGRAEFEEWLQKFQALWYAPIGELLFKMVWESLSPDEHQALRQITPQAHDQLEQMIGGKNATTTRIT